MPATAWPATCTRIVAAPWPDEPDLELPPAQLEPTSLTETEQALLAHLIDAGAGSVREVAAAGGMPRSSVCRGLHRLRDQGLARLAQVAGVVPTRCKSNGGFSRGKTAKWAAMARISSSSGGESVCQGPREI